jgi:hypothetical protein
LAKARQVFPAHRSQGSLHCRTERAFVGSLTTGGRHARLLTVRAGRPATEPRFRPTATGRHTRQRRCPLRPQPIRRLFHKTTPSVLQVQEPSRVPVCRGGVRLAIAGCSAAVGLRWLDHWKQWGNREPSISEVSAKVHVGKGRPTRVPSFSVGEA